MTKISNQKLVVFIIAIFLFLFVNTNNVSAQCNTNTSVCNLSQSPVFNFVTPGGQVSTCLDFFGPNVGYIVLYITQSGQLNMLINGNSATGFLDVAVFNIPNGVPPCTAIQSTTNQIGCNYATNSSGCAQFGNQFPCPSTITAPTVVAGQTLMIVVENWSGSSSNFTIQLANSPGSAQTGLPNATINPAGPFCLSSPTSQLTAVNQGGTWIGPGTSSTGVFNPLIAGLGSHTINYSIGIAPCNSSSSITVTVNPQITPTFNPVASVCIGGTIAPLPTTSTNGITGTWSPALNNTATTTYTFTPTPGQCASTTTLTVIVNPQITPTFNPVASVCSGTTIAALPTTSTNGISGAWSPSLNNTVTTTYTFSPSLGQCATTTTSTITVNTNVLPTFNSLASVCSGATIAPLPTTSTNGISGTWSPALNNTSTTTYTFTPTAGQCASTTTLTLTINPQIQPTFNPVASVCFGTTIAPLPTTSTNGISGTWSPTLNNTSTTTYTFTPTAGQCASTATLTITINPQITPTFNPVASVCIGGTIAPLPTISTNGITGTWSPALNNTVTTLYTFTPNTNQCAVGTTTTISINSPVVPIFTIPTTSCTGTVISPLPSTSTNGINGTWSPQLNNMQTTSYTFLPTSGQCATSTSHTIVVNPLPIVNVSPLNSTICSGNQTNIELISQPVGATFGWLATSVGDASGFTTGTGSSIEQILTSTSTGTVNYEVVGVLNGCPSLPVNVTVDVIHTPVVNASSYIHNLCSDQSVVVNLSSSQPATTFTWTTAATNVTGSFNGSGPVINQQLSTSFGGSVIYSVTPTFGICTGNPIDILVNVDGEPIPLIAITTSEGCSPIDVFFNNTTVGNYSYSWNFGDGTSSSEVSPSHSYTQNGCYDALLMIVSPAGCVSQTLFENVACVSESPTAFFTATNQLLYEENAFNSFINGSQNATSYLWDFGDGSTPVTSINPSYNFPPVYGNTYNVTLTAINDEGCTDTYLMSFTVQDNLMYYVPNTFTPDGDQYNQTFKPIFTAGFDPYDFNLKIFNRWGELIFESYNHEVGWNGTYKAAEGTCPDGVYAWTIEFKTTSTDARKKIQGHVVLMK